MLPCHDSQESRRKSNLLSQSVWMVLSSDVICPWLIVLAGCNCTFERCIAEVLYIRTTTPIIQKLIHVAILNRGWQSEQLWHLSGLCLGSYHPEITHPSAKAIEKKGCERTQNFHQTERDRWLECWEWDSWSGRFYRCKLLHSLV